MSVFDARQNLSDDIRGSLVDLHEKLKLRSLWSDAQSNYSASHDLGLDMLMQTVEPSNARYVEDFDTRAEFSALQLRIAQIIGLVDTEPKGYESAVQELPTELLPYWELNAERDGNKAMAFGSNMAGRFESGISRRVVVKPEYLGNTLEACANELLDSSHAGQVKAWWGERFPVPPPEVW